MQSIKLKSFNDFSNVASDKDLNEMEENPLQRAPKTMEDYWNTVDPETGMRFEIPMLKFMDNEYKLKYINYMKMRESDPVVFEGVMRWN